MIDHQKMSINIVESFINNQQEDYIFQTRSIEERTTLLILRDLLRIGWRVSVKEDRISISPPSYYDKYVIKSSMEIKRQESINKNSNWIRKNISTARGNLANGVEVWESEIKPTIEVCTTQDQFNLFRVFRYYWSSPYSDYVGRRIKILVRDDGLPQRPIIGIAALGSSIIHIPERDIWVGWNRDIRTKRIIYTMDAYVLGALPPYNFLLGGKLMAYIIASNEIREIFHEKYKDVTTQISKRRSSDLICIFTTGLYGKSSQYNRIRYGNEDLFTKIGNTKGFGSLHLTDETFISMRKLLESHHIIIDNKFGDGPVWRMRVIRSAADILGIDSDLLLKHSFQRSIYAIPLAQNFKEFLNGKNSYIDYYDYPMDKLVDYWHNRWLLPRKANNRIKESVLSFKALDFNIF